MLAVTPIDMSLAPLQITITSGRISRFQFRPERLRTAKAIEFNHFRTCEFVFSNWKSGQFLFITRWNWYPDTFLSTQKSNFACLCTIPHYGILVFRIRRWRVHLPLIIPGSVSCTLCFEMRTILSLGERKGTHFNLLFSNVKNGWLILLSSPPPWYDCNKWCKSILISCFPF